MTFDESIGGIDTTVYNPMLWAADKQLPHVEDTRYVGNNTGASINEEVSRRQGTTLLEVGPSYRRSGTNGLRVRVRNRFNVGEYVSDSSNSETTVQNVDPPTPSTRSLSTENFGWFKISVDGSDTTAITTTSITTGSGILTTSDNFVHGPWVGTGAESVNGIRKKYTSLISHSLVHVKLTYILVGQLCTSTNESPSFMAVDIDGDTIFAHAREVIDETTMVFRDTLKDGNAYGRTYVAPKTDPKTPLMHHGYTAFSFWQKSSITLASDSFPNARYYAIDVKVPHSTDNATLSIRYIPSTDCSKDEKWAVGDLIVETLSTPKAPFRPWVPMSTKGAGNGLVVPETHTWIRFDTSAQISSSDYLAYSFRIVKWPQVMRGWAVELSNLDHNVDDAYDVSNLKCRNTNGCDDIKGCPACRDNRHTETGCELANNCLVFYRICYSWKELNDWPCDETHRPTRGIWHDETVDIYNKFASRYKNEDSSDPMRLRVQFVFSSSSSYAADQDIEIHFDDIKIGGVSSYASAGANGCGDIELKSDTSTTSGNYGMEIKIKKQNQAEYTDIFAGSNAHDSMTNGFCYVIITQAVGDIDVPLLSVACLDPNDGGKSLGAVIDTMNDGDRMLLVSFGDTVQCKNDATNECAQSLERLGGIAVQWPIGSSLAFVGRKGAEPGTMPMSLELKDEGSVSTKTTFYCPDIDTKISETTAKGGVVGPPLARLNPLADAVEARFHMVSKPSGYLGCFRDRWYTSNFKHRDMWHRCNSNTNFNTAATCAKCCLDKGGFTISGLTHHHHYCHCGDTIGSFECDDVGQQCGVPKLSDNKCGHRAYWGDSLQTNAGALTTHGGSPGTRQSTVAAFLTTGEQYLMPKNDLVVGGLVKEITCPDNTGTCYKLHDRDYETYWESASILGTDGKAVIVELIEFVWFSRVRVHFDDAANKVDNGGFDVQVSLDGNTYSDIRDWNTGDYSSSYWSDRLLISETATPTKSKFIKITFKRPTTDIKVRVEELLISYYSTKNKKTSLAYLSNNKRFVGTNFYTLRDEYAGGRGDLRYTNGAAQAKPWEYWSMNLQSQIFGKHKEYVEKTLRNST